MHKNIESQIDHLNGLPEDRIPVLRIPALTKDTNIAGDIFGGWIMSQVDLAGSIPAMLRAKGRVVTVAVTSMTFLKPVLIGDLISLYADVQSIRRTSITVEISAYAQRNPLAPECLLISKACLVYVAVNEQGQPRPVESD